MDQDALALGETGHLEKVGPDGEERLRQRRRANGIIAVRKPQSLAGRENAIFGIGTAVGETADLVADGKFRDAARDIDDFAGNFQPEYGAGILRRRIDTLPLRHIWPVDAGRLDPNEDLAIFQHRQRLAGDGHDLGRTEGRQIHKTHFRRQAHSSTLLIPAKQWR